MHVRRIVLLSASEENVNNVHTSLGRRNVYDGRVCQSADTESRRA